MSNILFDISGKINTEIVDVLTAIKEVADSLNIAFFVVGATARDIILQHCYNVTLHRATKDVDIGVEVADWDEFNELFKALISTGDFSKTRQKQRLLYKNRAVDIVPFGPIAGKEKKISWPPEQEIFMNLLGFEEAYEDSITIRLNNDPFLDIKLPTLPGLVIMKLISWDEKYPERKKDANDILFIMHNYDRAGIENRLYETEQDLVEDSGFDMRDASIRLLGRDMAKIADSDTLEKLKEILNRETDEQGRCKLVMDMISGSLEYEFEEVLELVETLLKGINDIRKN